MIGVSTVLNVYKDKVVQIARAVISAYHTIRSSFVLHESSLLSLSNDDY